MAAQVCEWNLCSILLSGVQRAVAIYFLDKTLVIWPSCFPRTSLDIFCSNSIIAHDTGKLSSLCLLALHLLSQFLTSSHHNVLPCSYHNSLPSYSQSDLINNYQTTLSLPPTTVLTLPYQVSYTSSSGIFPASDHVNVTTIVIILY